MAEVMASSIITAFIIVLCFYTVYNELWVIAIIAVVANYIGAKVFGKIGQE